MRKSSLYLFLLAALTLGFGACKKDDDKSNSEKLVDKNWRMIALTADPAININGTQFTDLFAQLQDCDKDDLTVFKANSVVNYDEGTVKCNTSDPQTTVGIWAINADETIVTVDGESWTILELNDTQLKVKYTADPFNLGFNSTFTATFQKN